MSGLRAEDVKEALDTLIDAGVLRLERRNFKYPFKEGGQGFHERRYVTAWEPTETVQVQSPEVPT